MKEIKKGRRKRMMVKGQGNKYKQKKIHIRKEGAEIKRESAGLLFFK